MGLEDALARCRSAGPALLIGSRFEVVGGERVWRGLSPSAELLHVGRHLAALGRRVVAVEDPSCGLPEDVVRLVEHYLPSQIVVASDLPHVLRRALQRMGRHLVASVVDECGTDLRDGQGSEEVAQALQCPAVAAVGGPAARLRVSRSAVAAAGILVSLPCGTPCRHEEVRSWVGEVDAPELDGELVGLAGARRLRGGDLGHLLDAVAEVRPRFARLGALLLPDQVPALDDRLDRLRTLSVVRLSAAAPQLADHWDDLDQALARLESVGVDRLIEAHFTDIEDVEAVVELAERHGALIEPNWADAVDARVRSVGASLLAEFVDRHGRSGAQPPSALALAHLFTGDRPARLRPSGPQAVLWAAAPAEEPPPCIGAATTVFAVGSPGGDDGGPIEVAVLPGGQGQLGSGRVDIGGERCRVEGYAAARLLRPSATSSSSSRSGTSPTSTPSSPTPTAPDETACSSRRCSTRRR